MDKRCQAEMLNKKEEEKKTRRNAAKKRKIIWIKTNSFYVIDTH